MTIRIDLFSQISQKVNSLINHMVNKEILIYLLVSTHKRNIFRLHKRNKHKKKVFKQNLNLSVGILDKY